MERVYFELKTPALRPSSDVVLLWCWTWLQLGSTIAQQMHNPDSDVGNVMQNTAFTQTPSAQLFLWFPHGNIIPLRYIAIIYEFCLAQQGYDIWITAVPESYTTAKLVRPNCTLNLIQKFDSDTILLPCFVAPNSWIKFSMAEARCLNWA